MKNFKKQLICLLMSFTLCVNIIPFHVKASGDGSQVQTTEENQVFDENAHGEVAEEGDCGENAKYRLYSDGMLYIYGTGEITDSQFSSKYISNVYIEDGITRLGGAFFQACENIKEIRLPNELKYIGPVCFQNCENLSKIEIPEGLEQVEANTFAGCNSLLEITIPDSVKTIGERAFLLCEKLKTVKLPGGLIEIKEYAFNDCTDLEEIILPEGVETIGDFSFIGCGLKEVIMPNSVTSIEKNAFGGCSYLKKVLIPNNETKIEDGAFLANTDYNNPLTIYCNQNSKAEEYAKENQIPHKPISEWDKDTSIHISNAFNGCKGSPVKLSISCKEGDEFTFECTDNCGMKSGYIGYSSIQIGGFSSYSKNYELNFEKSGEHIIAVYENGNLKEHNKIIVAENHTWDSGIVKQNATCTKEGEKEYTCSNCKNKKTEKIPATNHEYKESITRQVTCESSGEKTYRCSKCGDSYTETIQETGHNFGEWEISKKPTIFNEGKKTRVCALCWEEESEEIDKLKSSVKISKKKMSLKIGKTYKLKIKKKTKGDKVASWTSSKSKIVSVNKKTGKIKAKKKGKAIITIKMKSGCKATCKVTVK